MLPSKVFSLVLVFIFNFLAIHATFHIFFKRCFSNLSRPSCVTEKCYKRVKFYQRILQSWTIIGHWNIGVLHENDLQCEKHCISEKTFFFVCVWRICVVLLSADFPPPGIRYLPVGCWQLHGVPCKDIGPHHCNEHGHNSSCKASILMFNHHHINAPHL